MDSLHSSKNTCAGQPGIESIEIWGVLHLDSPKCKYLMGKQFSRKLSEAKNRSKTKDANVQGA